MVMPGTSRRASARDDTPCDCSSDGLSTVTDCGMSFSSAGSLVKALTGWGADAVTVTPSSCATVESVAGAIARPANPAVRARCGLRSATTPRVAFTDSIITEILNNTTENHY